MNAGIVQDKNGIMRMFICKNKMTIYVCSVKDNREFKFSSIGDLNRFIVELKAHITAECARYKAGMYELECYFNPMDNVGMVICNVNQYSWMIFADLVFTSGMETCIFKFE
jgi:hypothetical protein